MKKLFWPLAISLSLTLFLPRPSQGASGIGNDNPTGVTGEYNGSVTTGGSYDPYTGNAKRFIDDLTVTGSIGDYPLKWTRILNTRGGSGKFGDGGGWTHNYRWGLTLQPHPGLCGQTCICEGPDGSVYYPDGRIMNLRWEEEPHAYVQADGQEPMGDRLVHVDGGSGNYYDLWMKDGGRVEFRPAPGVSGATAIVDPYGLRTTIEYDASGRLWKITEPGGRFLQISYQPHCYWNQVNPPQYVCTDVISQVEAHDGLGHMMEKVMYSYEEVYAQGLFETMFVNLTQVAYDDGSHASYVYNDPARVNPGNPWSLCAGTVKTCNDVRYAGPMSKIEYEYVPSEGGQAGAYIRGQIKAERNMTTHQVVSSVDYQGGLFDRTEIRPDGATRHFGYRGVDGLDTYTNFTYPGETPRNTTIAFTDPAPGNPDHYLRTVTDALLHTTKIEKERNIGAVMAVIHPTSVIHPNASSIQYAYTDPNNPYYLASKTDENTKVTYYDRNSGGPNPNRIWQIRYPDNASEQFTYNNFGQVLTHLMTSGGTEEFTYDNRGLKRTYTPPWTPSDPDRHQTIYTYYENESNRPDRIDRLKSVTDPLTHTTTFDYDVRGNLTYVTHPDNKFTQNHYNYDGTLDWTADENHPDAATDPTQRTRYEYDEYKRVTKVTNPMNESTFTSYDPDPSPSVDLSLTHTTSSVYRVTSQLGRETDYEYDANFRRITTIQASGTNDAAITRFTYDEVGNLQSTEDPRHKFTTFVYDERNRQTSVTNVELGETTAVEYDPASNKTIETRPDGTFRTWDYDSMNRLWHAYDWRTNVTPTPNQTTIYDRDHAGNARFITDTKGAIYSFVYDQLNRKESATNPSDNTIPPRTESWRYDIAGNLDTYTNPANQQRHFHYDARNRQDRSWWDGGVGVGQDIVTGYDDASRVTSVVTKNGETPITTLALGYDEANRKIWEEQTLAGQPTHRVKTDLDLDGKRLNLQIIPGPHEGLEVYYEPEMQGGGLYLVNYEYTARNQLKKSYGENWEFNYSYDPSGNMTTRQSVYNGVNSSTNCPNYDALNRPRTWEQTGPNGFHALSHYKYDQENREVANWREDDNNLGDRFTYEPTNQVASAAYHGHVANGPPSDASRTVTYAYTADKLNRSSMSDAVATTTTTTSYTPNAFNQYTNVAGVTCTYDSNFNLAHMGSFMAVYDAANRLSSASNSGVNDAPAMAAGFVYDGLGRCVKRTLNGVATVFAFDGWKPIMEWDDNGNLQAWNVYGPGADEILLRHQGPYGYIRFQLDRHGNVAFLLDNDGREIEKYTYDAFGRPTVTDWDGGRPRSWSFYGHCFLFQGREYIRELGIYDYRNRFYYPALGRFLQTDPTGLQIEGAKLSAQQTALYPAGDAPATFSSSELNLYRYCHNDPVNGSDPFGLNALFMVGGNRENPAYFTKIAEAWANKYEESHKGQEANVVQVRTKEDVNNALKQNHNLDRVDYVGHSSSSKLYLSDKGVLSKGDVASLFKDNVKPGASIMLSGCNTGNGRGSIAEAFANRFGQTVIGAHDGLSFGLPLLNRITDATNPIPRTEGTIAGIPYIFVNPTQ